MRLISAINSLGAARIQFTGGEPFLDRDRLMHLCREASPAFQSVEVFTNGTLVQEKDLVLLRDQNVGLAVSLYSIEQGVHDGITSCPGSCQQTLRTLRRAKALGVRTRVSVIAMAANAPTVDCTVAYVEDELGFHAKVDIVRLTGRATSRLLSEDLIHRKLIKKSTFQRKQNAGTVTRNRAINRCLGRKLYIASNGDVYPCVMERRLPLGNLASKPLFVIVGGADAQRASRLTKDLIKECSHCEFRYFCSDCRPDSNGSEDLNSKPWYCTYLPMEGRWMTQKETTAKIKEILNDHQNGLRS